MGHSPIQTTELYCDLTGDQSMRALDLAQYNLVSLQMQVFNENIPLHSGFNVIDSIYSFVLPIILHFCRSLFYFAELLNPHSFRTLQECCVLALAVQ